MFIQISESMVHLTISEKLETKYKFICMNNYKTFAK